jgi:methyl-accepting chemotaxis protein
MDRVTQTNAAGAEQTAAAAEELNAQSAALQDSVEDLRRLVDGGRHAPVDKIAGSRPVARPARAGPPAGPRPAPVRPPAGRPPPAGAHAGRNGEYFKDL